jgi:hypothetical protein
LQKSSTGKDIGNVHPPLRIDSLYMYSNIHRTKVVMAANVLPWGLTKPFDNNVVFAKFYDTSLFNGMKSYGVAKLLHAIRVCEQKKYVVCGATVDGVKR